MMCQSDFVKKEISLKLTVMTTVALMVAVVVASIIPNKGKYEFHNHDKRNVIKATIKCSPLKTCCCPWFKHFAKHIVGSKFAACTWQRRALGCCAVGAFPQTPGNNRIDRFLCHNSGARPKQWWSPLTHSLDQVVGGGGCSLIQSKESFRAAYLGAGGSLAMVDLEREVGRGQEERGADGYGRGRGGSSRMKHRSEEEVAAPNGGARASSGGAWTRAAR
jgi:hypothetical protein